MRAFPLRLEIVFGLFFIIIFLVFPFKIFAAQIFLSSPSANLNSDWTYPVDLEVNSKVTDGTTYYLRAAFFLSGTTNYCGATLNNTNDWYEGPYTSNQGWLNLPSITINNSSWSGRINAKFDFNDNACSQNGNYTFKILRYTTNGSSSSDETQNPISFNIVVPSPTPTLVSMTNTPTPSPSQTPVSPTKKPTIFNTPTEVPTDFPFDYYDNNSLDLVASDSSNEAVDNNIWKEVLGTQSAKKSVSKPVVNKNKNNNWIIILIGIFIVLLSCAILVVKFLWEKGKIPKFW